MDRLAIIVCFLLCLFGIAVKAAGDGEYTAHWPGFRTLTGAGGSTQQAHRELTGGADPGYGERGGAGRFTLKLAVNFKIFFPI
jgi:hypothetical protein